MAAPAAMTVQPLGGGNLLPSSGVGTTSVLDVVWISTRSLAKAPAPSCPRS